MIRREKILIFCEATTKYKLHRIFILTLFMIIFCLPSIAQAADKVKGETISLNREKILELSAKNYMAVQQQNLQIQLDNAQLSYSEGQRKEMGSYYAPVVDILPTSLEELRKLVPNYEDMLDTERNEVDAALMIQAMINASMNEMLTAQANYQNTVGIQQWSAQIESLDNSVSAATHTLKVSKLEKEKLELLAQFYAIQSYYEIMELQVDIRVEQFEVQTAKSAVNDFETLYRLGLTTKREVEQAEQSVVQHQQNLMQVQKKVESKKNELKQMLGLKKEDTMILPKVEEMKMLNNYDDVTLDIKKQIEFLKAEEASNQAMKRHDAANSKDVLLSNFLQTLLVVEVEKKMIVEQWLEQKAEFLNYEHETITYSIKELEEQKDILLKKLQDYERLYSTGGISERDYEAVSHELTRLTFSLEKRSLQHLIWQEKKRIAVLGVLQ